MGTSHHSVIRIKGARQHNLRNLDIEIPRNQLVVITGLSGSGKSSLAFDTLYAEGQRKYVESLSAYARQFLDQMQKPDVDYIEGLSPAIAIEQRTSGANPRSTIATTTEIYDYLRLLFAAIGRPHDPATGEPVVRQTPQQIADVIAAWPEGTRFVLLAPLIENEVGEFRDVVEKARREGFVRLRIDGETIELGRPDPIKIDKAKRHVIEAVVDRLVVRDGIGQRLADSIETALRWGNHRLTVSRQAPDGGDWTEQRFSTDYCNPATGFTMPRLTPKHFSFNSHLGACPACHGIGTQMFCDPELMVDAAKSLAAGAIKPWRTGNKRMRQYYGALLGGLVREFRADEDAPFKELPGAFKDALFFGTGDRAIPLKIGIGGKVVEKPFEGLVQQLERLLEKSESEFTKNRIRAFTGWKECAVCHGARLRPEILAVTVNDTGGAAWNINSFCALSVARALEVANRIELNETERHVVEDVLREVRQRLGFLNEVGLSYLSLNRESGTLSGGEAQRIRLATQIGSGLAGVLYVLDEPSIGLHQRDNERLIGTLRNLRDLGNSVIVVEHDEDTIRAADHVLDLGPGAGPRGGRLVAQGTLDQILQCEESLTAQYLTGRLGIRVPKVRVPPRKERRLAGEIGDGWLTVRGARENNLKNVTAAFPASCLTCVTGVSGSGKSTLVNDILRAALARDLNGAKEKPGAHGEIVGIEQFDKVVVIDQSAVGRTPRSNPATYSGALGPIRDLFAQLPSARVRGYTSSRFSFNMKGGRCEHCQGDGFIKIEMHFLADVYVECEICHGRRYNRETLEITYKGKNIADVLDMTIDEAARFFRNIPSLSDKLDTMLQVGLGYLRLGQSATTLSGGEAQRLKLASELARRATGRTVYILDEPTTGLHFADIHKLLEVLIKLRDARNTLIVIEHNLEVIKTADWVIDLGPEGGEGGGQIIAEGTPEAVAACERSHTGRYLKAVLDR
ncbi:MAG: excinuclease ABC subunit UvrA [Terrimicrobiaceae bacterium]|nr:excinuclease ABC subunit UvrA [Terrimicrobiaceae bacterium]